MKPETELYERVEEMAGKSGPAICYIDDRAENAVAGSARGWTAVLHSEVEKTLATLEWLT